MPRQISQPNAMELRRRIARWLRHYIRRTGASQKDVAEAMGITEATISNLLSENRWVGLDTFVAMHLRLGLSLEDMVRMDPPEITETQLPSRTVVRAARK